MFEAYFPKFTLASGKLDQRHGNGLGMVCAGKCMIVDAFEGGEPTKGLMDWLIANAPKQGIYTVVDIAFLTHPHGDHFNGIWQIADDKHFIIKQFICYNPRTLDHGVDSSANGRSVKEDIANLKKLIQHFTDKGIPTRYVGKGDVIQFGDITFRVYRKQPTKFGELDDDGHAYAFVNDGSLCLYSPEIEVLLPGDGPEDLEDALAYYNGPVSGYDVSHHGGSCPESDAKALARHGCVVAWQSCIERTGAGTTEWTKYGSRRVRQQGIPVWQQDAPITIEAYCGKIWFRQGNKTISKAVPYKGEATEGWQKNATGWWYRRKDGTWPIGWARLKWSGGTDWFYFDGRGYMVTGWQKLKWSQGTNWFYFDKLSGAMQTGWIRDKGYWYYLDKGTGAMQTGWLKYKEKWCYLEPVAGRNQGHAYASTTATISGKTYKFDADCYATEITDAEPEIIKNANFRPGRNCGTRSENVQYIVIHYTGAEGSAVDNINYFNNGDHGASAHYFVDRSGEIREYCDPLKYYAWHCGGSLESSHHPMHGICTNRNSIGIEICTHYNGKNWEFTEAAVNSAIVLTKYMMQKFNVPVDHVCRHYDVTGKACPRVPGWGAVGGDAEWDKFKLALGGVVGKAQTLTDNEMFIEEIGELAKADQQGICPAITIAQAILESGWGRSELAVKANNIFGMKCSLSGNTWPGSVWDGKSAYSKQTGEYYSGSYTTIKADFRVYKSWAESVTDHGAYLAGAKNGSALRYKGLVGEKDYKKAAQIIKNGEYATSPDYVDKLCRIVEQYDLTRFN